MAPHPPIQPLMYTVKPLIMGMPLYSGEWGGIVECDQISDPLKIKIKNISQHKSDIWSLLCILLG